MCRPLTLVCSRRCRYLDTCKVEVGSCPTQSGSKPPKARRKHRESNTAKPRPTRVQYSPSSAPCHNRSWYVWGPTTIQQFFVVVDFGTFVRIHLKYKLPGYTALRLTLQTSHSQVLLEPFYGRLEGTLFTRLDLRLAL